MGADVEQLNKEKEKIYEKMQPLRDLREEINALREERDALNQQVKDLSKDAREIRTKRDQLNNDVKKEKEVRDDLNLKFNETKKKYAKELQPKQPTDERKRGPTYSSLKESIEKLQWKIETAGVSFEEEKKMSTTLERMQDQLNEMKDLETAKRSMRDFGRDAKSHHTIVIELSKESETVHEDLMRVYEKLRKKREDANKKHESLLKKVEELKKMEEKFGKDIDRYNELKREVRSTRSRIIDIREEEDKKKYEAKAEEVFEKFKAGKKVDLRELQLKLSLEGDIEKKPKSRKKHTKKKTKKKSK